MEYSRKTIHSVKLKEIAAEIEPAIEAHLKRVKNGTSLVMIPQWPNFSNMIRGANGGRIIVIAAKTKMGKTTLGLNLAISASHEIRTLFFNMEMTSEDIMGKIIMSGAKISSSDWDKGNFDPSSVAPLLSQQIASEGVIFSDGRSHSVEEICSAIIQENLKRKLGLVIIDYDQKIRTPKKDQQWQELHSAIESLEAVAKSCEVAILIFAQANDKGEVKASGRIAQSASAVLHFYKTEEFGNTNYFLELMLGRFSQESRKLKVLFKPELSICQEGEFHEPSQASGEARPLRRFSETNR
jgi:replicative DNA helicase